jgi:hypothetical protein
MSRCPGSTSLWLPRPDKVGVFSSLDSKSEDYNQENKTTQICPP